MDRLPGGPYTLSYGHLWLQLSIPGTRKVMHMCIGMQEGEREREINVCVRVCVCVCLCVLHRKSSDYWVGSRTPCSILSACLMTRANLLTSGSVSSFVK